MFNASLDAPDAVHVSAFVRWAPNMATLRASSARACSTSRWDLLGVIGIQRGSDVLDFVTQTRYSNFSEAAAGFIQAWREIGASGAQQAYVTANPSPASSKELYDSAPGPEQYNTVHGKYHRHLRDAVLSKGYYGLFIVDLQGDVVYTVCKEVDFATNLVNGPWKSTGLVKAFRRASAAPGDLIETGFEPYAPSDYTLSGSTAAVVKGSGGTVIGFLILQNPYPMVVAIDIRVRCARCHRCAPTNCVLYSPSVFGPTSFQAECNRLCSCAGLFCDTILSRALHLR